MFNIPQFKFNLLSVLKITKEFQRSTTFFPDFCVLQDFFTGKVRKLGKKEDGLYLLSQAKDNTLSDILDTRANTVLSDKGKCNIEL